MLHRPYRVIHPPIVPHPETMRRAGATIRLQVPKVPQLGCLVFGIRQNVLPVSCTALNQPLRFFSIKPQPAACAPLHVTCVSPNKWPRNTPANPLVLESESNRRSHTCEAQSALQRCQGTPTTPHTPNLNGRRCQKQ